MTLGSMFQTQQNPAYQYAAGGKFAYDPSKGSYGVNTGSGYEWLPTYDAADFGQQTKFVQGWNPEWGDQETGQGQWEYDQEGNRGYTQSYYGLNPDSASKYGDLFGGGRQNNWQMEYGSDPNAGFNALLKSGDKEGTRVQYTLQDGKYVPKITGMQQWDTNDAKQNLALAKLAMTGLSMGALGPALQGLGGALEAGAMPTLGQVGTGINFANTFSGGQIPGLKELGLVAGLGGDISNLGNFANKGISSLGDIAKLGQTGYNVYSKGNKVMDMFSGPDEQYANTTYQPKMPGGTAPRPYTEGMARTQGGNASGGGFDWSSLPGILFGGAGGGNTGIMDIYGAYKGSKEARDEAFRLQNLYNDAQGRRQPYLDKLKASYDDPNSFYDSNQWKGLSSVYQNSIDRNAAKTGRMANPTDREVLMQQHAMKALEDYRGGLSRNAQMLNPDNYINPFMRGSTREANAANPYFALGGRGSVGGPGFGVQDAYGTLSKLAQSFGGFDKIPSFLKDMFGSGANPNYGSPEGGFESDFPTGGFDPNFNEWGGMETSPGFEGVDTGNFDYSGQGWDMGGDWGGNQWDDASWIDDFGDWF